MDLSGIIVVALGALFFFGGVAWLEIRSRKNTDRQGEHSTRLVVSTTPAEMTGRMSEAESE
jgi:hypothetical protein